MNIKLGVEMMQVQTYLAEKGWQHKKAGDQYCLRECPLCGDDKWHFYINSETGAWDCKKCFARGNLYQLRKELGDMKDVKSASQIIGKKDNQKPLNVNEYMKRHKALLDNAQVMNYLKEERGFTEETIKHFKLGVSKDKEGTWLNTPHFGGDKLLNVKLRSLPPTAKKFKRIPGKPSILFNQDCLNDGFKEIFITEGETDTMSLWQLGFKNVVGITAGAGSFLPEWHEKLEEIENIYLCFDSDDPGQKGAYIVADKLGFERCRNILLPKGQDLNDYLKKHNKDDFIKLAAQAKKFKIPSISSIRETITTFQKDLESKPFKEGIITAWENVNRRIKGFEPGDLIILSAIPKIGKTTFALQITYHNTMNNIPCLFYCLEMRPERLLKKISSMVLDREIPDDWQEMRKAIEEARERIENLPLFFGHTYKRIDLDFVLNTIRTAAKRYDIKFVVFDHLHFLVRDVRYVTHQVGLVTQSFKLLAEELEIPIMMIAQPRKTNPGEMMNMMDLKDSASIGADADQIIILHRDPIKSDKRDGIVREELRTTLKPETLVRVEASRYNPGGDTILYFEGAKSKFKRID